LFGASSKKEEKTTNFSIPKFPTAMGQVNLATSLQYGSATGIFQFQVFCKEFSTRIFQPAYDDFATLVHTGNTDAYVVMGCGWVST
jgi:aromatic amino acid aminotransferase I